MNRTNRALNRALLATIGLLLAAIGAAGVAIMSWRPAADIWGSAAQGVLAWLDEANAATVIADGTATGLGLVAVSVIFLLVVLLLVIAVRSVAGRRAKTIVRLSGAQSSLGRITVTEAFVSDAIRTSLEGRDEVLTARVIADDVKDEPVLCVDVTPRQNTDPRELADRIDLLLTNLAALTGRDTAACIVVRSGLRARLAHDERRLA